uniref:C3H1-type domain-containing protein n=1 Tax=Cucumis sativus TaxID=3659 RepID=A0A0A0KHP2_CUCSA
MDTKRHDKHLRSETVTATENSEVNKLSFVGETENSGNIEFSSPSGKPLEKKEEQSHGESTKFESQKCLKDKGTEDQEPTVGDKDVEALRNKDFGGSSYNKVPLCNSEVMVATATNGSSDTLEDSDIGSKNHSAGRIIGTKNPERESEQMGMQLDNGENQMASRSTASKKRSRSLTPVADVNGEEKHPAAAICDFYAKGWCIKGSSCSFLHIKNNAYGSDQHSEERAGAACLKKQAQLNEVLSNGTGLQYNADVLKSPREDSLLSALPDCQKLPSTSFGASFPLSRGLSASRLELPPEFGVSSDGFTPLGVMEEPTNVACPRLLNDHLSPVLRTSLNSNPTLPRDAILSSRFTTSNASLFPLTSSSSASLLNAHKMSIIDREHHVSTPASSLMRSSPFSASGSDNSFTHVSKNPSEYKMKCSSDDWEPSVPFRPSFFIPSITTASQYDPFLDSMEVPRIVGCSYNVTLDRQGHEEASPLSTLQRASGNFVVPGSSKPEFNDDTSSLSSHNKAADKNGKVGHLQGKDPLLLEPEIRGSFGLDGRFSRTREDDHKGLTCEKDVTKKKKMGIGGELKLPNISLHEKDSEADSDRQLGDMDGKHLMEGNAPKESKATRHFRSALIELVKEILKPKWREGHLKKDVHNTVVKKTFDKVLGALQSHQVPTTVESVKQYLSSSRPKIEKLVEGYVSKYGKS